MNDKKTTWPSDLQGLTFGSDCRFFIDFDYGEGYSLNPYELDVIRNVDVGFTAESADVTSRHSFMFTESYPGIGNLEVSFEALLDENDDVCRKIHSMHLGKAFALVGVFTERGAGPLFYAYISSLTRKEGVDDFVSLSINLKCAKFIAYYNEADSTPIVDVHGNEIIHPFFVNG